MCSRAGRAVGWVRSFPSPYPLLPIPSAVSTTLTLFPRVRKISLVTDSFHLPLYCLQDRTVTRQALLALLRRCVLFVMGAFHPPAPSSGSGRIRKAHPRPAKNRRISRLTPQILTSGESHQMLLQMSTNLKPIVLDCLCRLWSSAME